MRVHLTCLLMLVCAIMSAGCGSGGGNQITTAATSTGSGSLAGSVFTVRESRDNLQAVAWGNGVFVGVGYHGAILTSSGLANATRGAGGSWTWTTRASGTAAMLFSVDFGNGTFVAVGGEGTILTSRDGSSWMSRRSGTSKALAVVRFVNGQFVAGGQDGTLLTSPDGITWTARAVPAALATESIMGVAYGDAFGTPMYLAVTGVGHVITSHNGVAWGLLVNLAAASPSSIAFGNGRFIIVGDEGQVYVSTTDPQVWDAKDAAWPVDPSTGKAPNVNGITYGNTLFVAVANTGAMAASWDTGATWHQLASPTTLALKGVVSNPDGEFAAVGTEVLESPNGVDWAQSGGLAFDQLEGIAYGNGLYVAVGRQGTARLSQDGVSWTSVATGSPWLHAVTWGAGMFVAVGDTGDIRTSPDGITWTQRTSGTLFTLYGVTCANPQTGGFVAVGSEGSLLTSPDGVTWTLVPTPTTNRLLAVTAANGLTVATGVAGTVLVFDGVQARRVSCPINLDLNCVTWGAGTFVAAGADGGMVTSTDGVNWTSLPFSGSYSLQGLAYGNNLFLAVGSQGTFMTSPDGVTWRTIPPFTGAIQFAVTYGASQFVAVGMSGDIVTSP